MATRTALRADVARQALEDVQARKAKLVMRGRVTPEEWGRISHEEEAATLALAEAERHERERAEAERLAAIEAIKAEIAERADPADVIAALGRITDAITELWALAGYGRSARISEWVSRLQALGVPADQRAADCPGGISWTRGNATYGSGAILLASRAVQPVSPSDALMAATADACRAVGTTPGVFGFNWAPNGTAADWVRARY